MTELFVSYSRDDSAVIEPIVENLRRLGFDLWIDIEHLTPGTAAWTQAIDQALHRADGILAFLSPASKDSQWCNIETIRAQQFGKSIYPVLLSGDEITAVPIQLVNAQYTDMRGRASREREFDHLVQTLSHELDVDLPAFEIDADTSGQPVVQVIVSGHMEGDIIAIGGDVAGDVNVAGGDIRHETTNPPSFEVVTPPESSDEIVQPYDKGSGSPSSTAQASRKSLLVGGGIAGLVVLGLLIIVAINLFGEQPAASSDEAPTPTESRDETTPELTEEVVVAPTKEVDIAISATPPPGFEPVTHNADWEPIIEEFEGVEMALVPAGCFMMGSSDREGDQRPVHEVCFEEPFWIDVYEVTNSLYGSDGCYSGPDYPRECISWFAAIAHCERRGGRLPTEAEWEYVARGPDSLAYPWGDAFVAENVVYRDSDSEGTAPVGSKPGGVSWVGAYDLSGNIMEWTNDWYSLDYYGSSATVFINPQGPSSGSRRVLRGGSHTSNESSVHAAFRDKSSSSYYNYRIGFRCARSYRP